MTTASDNPSYLCSVCVVCVGRFPRGVLGGGGQVCPPWLHVAFWAAPRNFFWVVFAIFSGFVN
jgi:hypothetical protein